MPLFLKGSRATRSRNKALSWALILAATISASQTWAQNGSAPSMDEAIRRLETRLAGEPNDPEGWVLLGRSYTFLGRDADAQHAFEQARTHGYEGEIPATKRAQPVTSQPTITRSASPLSSSDPLIRQIHNSVFNQRQAQGKGKGKGSTE